MIRRFSVFVDPELLVSNFPIVTIHLIFNFLVFFSFLKGKNVSTAISYFIRKLSGLNSKFRASSVSESAALDLWWPVKLVSAS